MSEDAERSVIGSLLLDRDAIALIGPWLKAGAFGSVQCRTAYEACLVCWKDRIPLDLTTVQHGYHSIKQPLDIAFLFACTVETPLAVHVEHYAGMVAKNAKQRAIHRLGAQMAQSDPETYQRLYQASVEEIETLEPSNDDMVPYSVSVPRFIKELESEWSGQSERDTLSTGFRNLDAALDGGFSPAELVYLAARPSIGKTALALQLAHNVARSERGAQAQGYDPRWVAIFSAEMSQRSLLHRALAEVSSVPISDMKTGRVTEYGMKQIRLVERMLASLPIVMNDRARPTIDQMLQRLDRWSRTNGPVRFVVFDYIELAGDTVGNKNSNEEQRISLISKGLKRIAKETGATVLALSQLNRNVESRPPFIPQLSDLRQSGSLEQDADRVLFLTRQDYYEDKGMFSSHPEMIVPEKRGTADVILAKNREGTVGTYPLRFSPHLTAFSSMEDKPR